MKRLYLIRHAKSSWRILNPEDSDRPLNKRGKKDAPYMGQRLKQHHVLPDLILSSPAKRALKTAKIIAKEIGYAKGRIVVKDSLYLEGSAALLQAVQDVDDAHQQLMLFSHNPAITALAQSLSGVQVDNIPTCGIFCIDFDVASWKEVSPGNGTFIFFDYPKKHA